MGSLIEKKNHDFCSETIALEEKARMLYLEMGKRFHLIREKKLYEPHWESWTEYCMEFKDISQSTISKMIAVHETFVLRYRFKPERLAEAGGWTKLYALTMLVKTPEEATEWLDKATVLSRVDLEKELVEVKTGIMMSSCKHKDTFTIVICRTCKDRIKTEESE